LVLEYFSLVCSLLRFEDLHLGQIPVETKGVIETMKQIVSPPAFVDISPSVTSTAGVAETCINDAGTPFTQA